jgi:hypothetical protein
MKLLISKIFHGLAGKKKLQRRQNNIYFIFRALHRMEGLINKFFELLKQPKLSVDARDCE